MATVGNVIKCKAAIAWEPGKPLSMEEIEVAPPKANEVRIKIVATGICGTEKQMLKGSETGLKFPLILGHEGAGIVESVGEGVTEVKPGDKVLTLALPQCRECNLCKNPDTNLCVKNDIGRYVGLMEDNTSRFTCRGKLIYHFVKTSTFTEYTVLPISSVVKIDDDAPLDRVCLIACGFSTGYGSVFNTAKVKPGSSCAVFGLGGVGFSIIKGCKAAGASRIIGINRSKFKFEKAKEVGATECLSTLDFERPIQEVLTEMSDGGIKYTFECTGNIDVMNEALQSCHIGLGTCVILGLPPTGQRMQVDPTQMLGGRTLKSSIFGGYKAKDDFPKLVSDFMAKKFDLEDLVSDTLPFEKVNEAFELMDSGKCVRCVLVFKDPE